MHIRNNKICFSITFNQVYFARFEVLMMVLLRIQVWSSGMWRCVTMRVDCVIQKMRALWCSKMLYDPKDEGTMMFQNVVWSKRWGHYDLSKCCMIQKMMALWCSKMLCDPKDEGTMIFQNIVWSKRWGHYDLSKCWQPFIQWCSITSQKTWISRLLCLNFKIFILSTLYWT
jgi:hypothetical protein